MSTVYFYSVCRVCTTSSDQKLNVFSIESKRKNLNTKISECLPLNIKESDSLPKVVCKQCIQQVENMFEFRNMCTKSQTTLEGWLSKATNSIKEENFEDRNTTGNTLTQIPFVQTPAIQNLNTNPVILQNNNEILNSIMQVTSLQQVNDPNQSIEKPSLQQYTITLGNKVPKTVTIDASKLSNNTQTTQQQQILEKDNKSNALNEFLKLKPNIKVTPIRKDVEKQQQQQHLQQQQHQQQQPQQTQTQQIFPQSQQQITIQSAQLPIQTTQQTTQIPQQITSLQFQQLLQQQQWQQQLQHQLQQLTTQFQPQQITITTPTPQATLPTTSNATTTTTATAALNDALSPNKNKKPKINFVLTSPTANVAQTAATTSTSAIPQFSTATTGTTTIAQQPQVQWQFQSTPNTINTVNTLQQQQSQTNLAPLLQQSVGMSAPLSASTMLSPNKCFLPITIKDENSDQQIVAHIDAKNFVLPTTTYQLQMTLQPQIATADGQPIVQLTPTSIPATLQLTPQDLTNHIFQALNNLQQQQQQAQLLQPQQQHQQHQQQPVQQLQTQHIVQQPQQQQQTIPTNNVQITSQQILQTANNANNFTNNNNVNRNNATDQQQNDDIKFKNTTITSQKYKITQLPGNTIEITPATDFEPQTKKIKTQQQQQQQLQQTQKQQTTLPTQYGGITVQRISSTKSATNVKTTQQQQQLQQQQQQSLGTTATTSTAVVTTIPKANVWNKQNVTISRITPQAQQQQQIKLSQNPIKTTQQQILKPQQQQQSVTKITIQQPTQQQPQISLQKQQQVKKRQSDQLVTHVETLAPLMPAKKTIRRVATKIEQPIKQQQQQQQQNETTTTTTVFETNKKPIATKIKLDSRAPMVKIATATILPTQSSSATTTITATKTNTGTTTTTGNTTPIAIKKENSNLSTKTPVPIGKITATQNTNVVSSSSGFVCSECQRVFKKKEHLTQHAKLHTGDRPFECTESGCNKTFRRREHLQRHLVSHSGQKMYDCDVCSKLFSRKDNLNKHKRIHTSTQNSSNYTCDVCNKSFTVKAYYEDHMQLHIKKEGKTETQQRKKPNSNKNVQQRPATMQLQQQQQSTQQIQIVQQQQQPPQQQQQIMHLQLPTVLTTQGLAGNTITVTQSNDPNKALGTHDANVINQIANYVQLGPTQFVDATTGQIVGHIKIDKS